MTWELVNDNNLIFEWTIPLRKIMNNKTNGAYNGDNEVLYLSDATYCILAHHTNIFAFLDKNILLTLILTQKN